MLLSWSGNTKYFNGIRKFLAMKCGRNKNVTKDKSPTDFDGHWVQKPVDGLVRESNVCMKKKLQ